MLASVPSTSCFRCNGQVNLADNEVEQPKIEVLITRSVIWKKGKLCVYIVFNKVVTGIGSFLGDLMVVVHTAFLLIWLYEFMVQHNM